MPRLMAPPRLDTVRRLVSEQDADAALVTHGPDIAWAVGFTGSNGVLVVTEREAHLVTDGRYREQAAAEVAGATVHVAPGPLAEWAAESGLLGGAATVAFQADHVTVEQRDRWARAFPETAFVGANGLLGGPRRRAIGPPHSRRAPAV